MIKDNFQRIVLVIFAIGAVAGIAAFALNRASSKGADIPALEMWGTLPAENFSFLSPSSGDKYFKKITYREIDPENFDRVFADALADGTGPDLIVLRDDFLLKQKNRLYQIQHKSYSAASFYETYIDAGGVFEGAGGFYALPAAVDPLVMYWNRDIVNSAGLDEPPSFWDEMRDFSERVTKTDGYLDIERSAVALGAYDNINNAKDIISLLLMQSGMKIVKREGDRYVTDFSQSSDRLALPPSEALNFYLEFAKPEKQAYSWNSGLPNSRKAFLAEDLAVYFGKASERAGLIKANPNLALGVSQMPQIRASNRTITTGNVYGFAIVKNTRKFNHAFNAAFFLSSQGGIKELGQNTGLPSVRRDLLREDPSVTASKVFVDSARIFRYWHDPNSDKTDAALSLLVKDSLSNKRPLTDEVSRLQVEINSMLSD